MIKKFILFCSCMFLFSNCETNEENQRLLNGKWNVTETLGGLMPSKFYNKGDFTWTFNSDEKTVTVINNVDIQNGFYQSLFSNNTNGTYNYDIIEEEENIFLLIEQRKGNIIIKEDGIMVDFGIAFDDIAYILKKDDE